MMKRLLVTGASGLIGGHIVNMAKGRWDVHGTCLLHRLSLSNVQMHALDFTNEMAIMSLIRSVKPDAIIHTAAWSDVDGCEKEKRKAYQINARATEIIAKEASELGAKMIYLSSDMVFDGQKGLYSESDAPNPINYYGLTKLKGEEFVLETGAYFIVARVALVYGHPLGHGNSFTERIMEKILQHEKVFLFHDQYRSPIWVNCLAQALLELTENPFQGILHLGGADRIDRFSFGQYFAERAKFSRNLLNSVSMHDFKTLARRPQDVSFCIQLAKNQLKTELMGYREGIDQMCL